MSTQHEIQTIEAFIQENKKDRYLEFLAKPKLRRKLTDQLAHFHDAAPAFRREIVPSQQTPEGIARILASKGAPLLCSAISEDISIDGREWLLAEVLPEVIGKGMGTILSCIPGWLAFVETEDERFILERTGRVETQRAKRYLRFTTLNRDEDSKQPEGIFIATYALRNSGTLPDYYYEELTRHLQWFSRHLPVPSCLGKTETQRAICWFKTDANQCLSHILPMVHILVESGVMVQRITTDRPGHILYRDEFQIVAQPVRKRI